MIKEPPRITKYNKKKTKEEIISEYVRTIIFSIILSVVFTTWLSVHARNEMIKNLYASAETRSNMDKQIAIQFINTHNDLLDDLKTKNYAVCMNVGSIYEAAGEYEIARTAYEFAVEKSKPGNYKAHYKLICVLLELNKFDEAEKVMNSVEDYSSKNLLKFKTRSNIVIGDKYYAISKFISASKHYSMAKFYYDKFSKQDKKVVEAIDLRLRNSYIHSADALVKMGANSEAYKYLKKAEKMNPKDFTIKYKLAIILSDLDPEESVKYLELLLDKAPQDIDYEIFGRALMKAANIADLDGRPTQAKYYRYKIHSIDLFVNRKVVYKNDVEVILDPKPVRKRVFTYPIKLRYTISNNSNIDFVYLMADFVLCENEEPVETITCVASNKEKPLLAGTNDQNEFNISFKRKVFTKKDLSAYTVKIYVYKDPKFKTLVSETRIPVK